MICDSGWQTARRLTSLVPATRRRHPASEVIRMSLIADRDEATRVLRTLIERASLPELIGLTTPTAESVDLLMLANDGEESEVELADDAGEIIATLYVDCHADPVDGWTIGLRGWRLADGIASV